MNQPAKMMMPKPVSGSMNLLVSLSRKSKILLPRIWISLQWLKDSSDATPSSQITTPAVTAAPLRPSAVFSSTNATTGSSSDMDEVSAAKLSRTKNSAPSTVPPVMLPKAIGSVTKIRPGPELGSRLCANTSGKIAMPAIRAIVVSRITTVRAVLSRFTSLPR